MEENFLNCRIFNTAANFSLDLPNLKCDRYHELFDDDSLENLKKAFPENYTTWILQEPNLAAVFNKIAFFLKRPVEQIVQLFLFYIVLESFPAYEKFVRTGYFQKSVFIEAFKAYNKLFLYDSDTKNIIAPDILICLVCYILLHDNHPQTEFEIPMEILPIILNIVGISPEDGYPQGFDPTIPYEKSYYETAPKESFFERLFHKHK